MEKLTGVNPFEHTGITLRSLGVSGAAGTAAKSGPPMYDVCEHAEAEEEDEIDPEAAELNMCVINGWKSSYVDVQKMANERRRKTYGLSMSP